jgi:uncharacterized protein DUF4154
VRAAAVLVVLLATVCAGADDVPRAPADELKAAFVFNFAKYVEWRDDAPAAGTPLDICVVGAQRIEAALARATSGKAIGDRPLVVRRVRDAEDVDGCQIAVLGDALPHGEARATLARLADRRILTIGDGADFPDDGGVIAFDLVGQKLRFQINARAAERAHLRISSQLLKLATRVINDPESRDAGWMLAAAPTTSNARSQPGATRTC